MPVYLSLSRGHAVHSVDAFSHLYSLVDSVHWAEYGWSGGIHRFADIEDTESFEWGRTTCGDSLCCDREGNASFSSHECDKSYSLGSADEGIDWIFKLLLRGMIPEFDYSRF